MQAAWHWGLYPAPASTPQAATGHRVIPVTAVRDCSRGLFTSPMCLHAPSQKDNGPLLNRKNNCIQQRRGAAYFSRWNIEW